MRVITLSGKGSYETVRERNEEMQLDEKQNRHRLPNSHLCLKEILDLIILHVILSKMC